LAANVPVVYAGEWLMQRIPMHIARYSACVVFILIGIFIICSDQSVNMPFTSAN